MTRPLVLIHGYSATGSAFDPVRDALLAVRKDLSIADINICTYISLNNEVTITDIAEGLDRAFREHPVLAAAPEFDAIVHSTGMLVIRSWLTNHGALASQNPRLKRLKHLIGVAPATWGSPQAAQGRTFLGALVKGDKQLGPDFMNAGNRVLEGLELGSAFTWELAHWDLLGPQPYYDEGPDTPFVSVFIGNKGYDGVSSVANSPGSDGTVRWSGCALTTRKITLDLTHQPAGAAPNPRIAIDPPAGSIDIPMIAVDNRCHSSLIADPDPGMIALMSDFLDITAGTDPSGKTFYDAWLDRARAYGQKGLAAMLEDPGKGLSVLGRAEQFFGHLAANSTGSLDGWQQFVLHVVDAHGQGINDYFLELVTFDDAGDEVQLQNAFDDVHAYGPDHSFRCFHVKLPQGIAHGIPKLLVRVHASTGTDIVCYQGYGDNQSQLTADATPVQLDVSSLAQQAGAFFAPFRTTLVQVILNREPLPLQGMNKVLSFLPPSAAAAS